MKRANDPVETDMCGEKQVFFSLNHASDTPIYQDLLAWFTQNHVAVTPWTTADFESNGTFSDEKERQALLIDQVANSSYAVVIVGEKSIDPESIDVQALNAAAWMKRPIIALNINQLKDIDRDRFPQLLMDQLVLHLPMEGQVVKYALESWKDESFKVRTMGQTGPVHYSNDIYDLIEGGTNPVHRFESPAKEPVPRTEIPHSPWPEPAAA